MSYLRRQLSTVDFFFLPTHFLIFGGMPFDLSLAIVAGELATRDQSVLWPSVSIFLNAE